MTPYSRQNINQDDINAVLRVLRSDYLTTGPDVEIFEQALADKVGALGAVAVGNGTQALHLALLAAGIGPGMSVIVPTITFVATANAVRMCGAEVAFADVDPITGLMQEPHALAAAARAQSPVRAIIPVHMGGFAANMARLSDLGWTVIEDACHALGAKDVGACSWSHSTVFSFHPVKSITTGEGGAVVSQDPVALDRMRRLRAHGLKRALDGGYDQCELGYNYRIDDMSAALGRSQLNRLDDFIAERRRIFYRYWSNLPAILPGFGAHRGSAVHLVRLHLEDAVQRDRVRYALTTAGYGTQLHYRPVHTQPYYVSRYKNLYLPGAAAYYAQTLSIPCYPGLDLADVDRICDVIESAL